MIKTRFLRSFLRQLNEIENVFCLYLLLGKKKKKDFLDVVKRTVMDILIVCAFKRTDKKQVNLPRNRIILSQKSYIVEFSRRIRLGKKSLSNFPSTRNIKKLKLKLRQVMTKFNRFVILSFQH